jgi:hypothetical protein
MAKSQDVSQFVDGFLHQAFPDQFGAWREAVKFFAKAMERDKSTLASKLGFTEDEGEDGNVEIQFGDPQESSFQFVGKRLHALEDSRGVVLRAGRVASKISSECFFVDMTGDLKDARQFGREIIEQFDADLGFSRCGVPAPRNHRKQVNSVHPPTAV